MQITGFISYGNQNKTAKQKFLNRKCERRKAFLSLFKEYNYYSINLVVEKQ